MENLKSHARLVDMFCSTLRKTDSADIKASAVLPRKLSTPHEVPRYSRELDQRGGDDPRGQVGWKDTIIRYHRFFDYCFADECNDSLELPENGTRHAVSQPVSVIVKDTRIGEDCSRTSSSSSSVIGKDAGENSRDDDDVTSKRRRFDSVSETRKSRRSPIPDEKKDCRYWEKRKRNNEAAKRSREARRFKELEVTKRCEDLQSENEQLKIRLSKLEERNAELDIALKVCKRLLASNNTPPV